MFTLQNPKQAIPFLTRAIRSMKLEKISLPVLGMVKLWAKDGDLTLQATNLDAFLTIHLQGEGDLAEVGIFYKDLLAALQGATHAALDAGIIRTDHGDVTFNVQPVDGMPLFPTPGKDSLPLPLTADILSFASHARSKDATKPILESLCIEFGVDGRLSMASTDGFRLAFVETRTPLHGKHTGDTRVIIPDAAIKTLQGLMVQSPMEKVALKFFKDDQLKQERQDVTFVGQDWSLTTRTTDGHFPMWRKVVPGLGSCHERFAVDAKAFRKAVKSAALKQDDYNKTLEMYVENGVAALRLEHPDNGISSSRVPVECLEGGVPFHGGFNCNYMEEIAATSLASRIRFLTANSGCPSQQITIQVHPEEGTWNAFVIVMPIQIAKHKVESAPEGSSPEPVKAKEAPSVEEVSLAETVGVGQDEGVSVQEEVGTPLEVTLEVFRSDVDAVQALGGLESMRAFKPTRWHGYQGANGRTRRAIAWAVPEALLQQRGIAPLTPEAARTAYETRRARKEARKNHQPAA